LAQPFIPGAWNHLKAPDAVFLQETN
jgi:hypothetical protein